MRSNDCVITLTGIDIVGRERDLTFDRWCKSLPGRIFRFIRSHCVSKCPGQRPFLVRIVQWLSGYICVSWHTLGTTGVLVVRRWELPFATKTARSTCVQAKRARTRSPHIVSVKHDYRCRAHRPKPRSANSGRCATAPPWAPTWTNDSHAVCSRRSIVHPETPRTRPN